jgi:hypothetical protein
MINYIKDTFEKDRTNRQLMHHSMNSKNETEITNLSRYYL